MSSHYEFHSRWLIPTDLAIVEAIILDSKRWRVWWPDIIRVEGEPVPGYVGARYQVTWRSVVGYTLDLAIIVTGYTEGEQMTFDSSGDLDGHGTFMLSQLPSQPTEIAISWSVTTTKRWMNLFAPVLRPFFAWNHRLLMSRGEKGLRQFIASQP